MKGLLQSKTIWGIISMLLGMLLAQYGVTSAEIEKTLALIIEVVGAILAVYGRIKAKKEIAGLIVPKN